MALIDEFRDECANGTCVAIAALVLALDKADVLPKQAYAAELGRLWLHMPEEQAVGEAGAVIERTLELLGASGATDNELEKTPASQRRFAVIETANTPVRMLPEGFPMKNYLRAV